MHQPSTSSTPIRRTAALLLGVVFVVVALGACGSSTTTTAEPGTTAATPPAGPKVVASTSWVGAVAKLAGATDITVVAPSSAQHPPDYDPKASDLAAIADADYVLVAGFEGFAERMKEAAGSEAEVVTVTPDYDPAKLKPEVDKLAGLWGTSATADTNMATYTTAYEAASLELKQTTKNAPEVVVAQMFVAGWAMFAGYEPAGTYGPEPTTASQVAELTALAPTLVFENSHMGGGAEIATSADAQLVNLVNFPGDDLELMPVVDANAETIANAVAN